MVLISLFQISQIEREKNNFKSFTSQFFPALSITVLCLLSSNRHSYFFLLIFSLSWPFERFRRETYTRGRSTTVYVKKLELGLEKKNNYSGLEINS